MSAPARACNTRPLLLRARASAMCCVFKCVCAVHTRAGCTCCAHEHPQRHHARTLARRPLRLALTPNPRTSTAHAFLTMSLARPALYSPTLQPVPVTWPTCATLLDPTARKCPLREA
eukprot:10146880-Alexandrium_andersonii.AAC.1